ncbi:MULTISPECIES: dihydroorotase [Actinopolyspora]|uniref:Dihydroorotase n=1 Tax=Actinopolyspora saharensis TaxID=995062 RepID=A0A1H0Z3L8_9ACTN|nr:MULTISPECIES: dihydroorotase family protein [Actinopolyspora]NHD16065.1 dihydroorotase family protein [Actinopolyspora sp. BKK2]NHE74721.1 dihydroorotase family protein [Actinopolyspora sp. BKK1]SDQ21741.1 dihydroorotase [Actinopolyspora saharensis]
MDGVTPSETFDLLIRGARVVTGDGVRRLDVAVSAGRVARLLEPGTEAVAASTIPAQGRYLLPGLIDSHVHFRTPGLTHKEDWAHGSRAAVAGGITTVIDMPNTQPPLFDPSDAHDKHAEIAGTSLVDYRFHAGVDPSGLERLERFTPREATSAKAFLAGHHTAPNVLRDAESLEGLFRRGADNGLRLLFHAEDSEVFDLLDQWHGVPGRYRDYERLRPRSGGVVAVAKLIELVRRYGTPIHVLHVSSREEADLLSAARAAGLPVSFEVTAHHLSFTAEDTERMGARIRLSPAIRDRTDQERLWSAVIDGEASCLGSDHAPHELSDKVRSPEDAPPGLPGVQELFPALFTGLRRRLPQRHTDELLRVAVRLLGEGPAGMFGLERKGEIRPGADADLVVFDPDANWMLDEEGVRSRCGWSAYQGWTFTGRVERTIRAGRTVFSRDRAGAAWFGEPDGVWLDERGAGESATDPGTANLVGSEHR